MGMAAVTGFFRWLFGQRDTPEPVPAPAPAPAPPPIPGPFRPLDLIAALNDERSKVGLGPLRLHPALTRAAQDWADEMARTGDMTHGNFSGRIQAILPFTTAGEDIAMGQRSVAEVMRSWMNSPPHRANILGPFNAAGVGHAVSGGRTAWCVDFDHTANL